MIDLTLKRGELLRTQILIAGQRDEWLAGPRSIAAGTGSGGYSIAYTCTK
jgi:hypothetical protein